MTNELSKIKELETELVKLRLVTRHIEFSRDYDRQQYSSQKYKTQGEIEDDLIKFLNDQKQEIRSGELISELVKCIKDLGERDFEKTNSGSIRIYSGIRAAIEKLAKQEVISKPRRGFIILTSKLKP